VAVVSFTTFENELLRKAVFSSVQIHLDVGGASALETSKAPLEEDGISLRVSSIVTFRREQAEVKSSEL
jgi:hypothetical protein